MSHILYLTNIYLFILPLVIRNFVEHNVHKTAFILVILKVSLEYHYQYLCVVSI